jgi:hypothetical protein
LVYVVKYTISRKKKCPVEMKKMLSKTAELFAKSNLKINSPSKRMYSSARDYAGEKGLLDDAIVVK